MPDIFQAFTIEQVFSTGIAVLIVFSGLLTILFVIWGGFLMIISGGNEEKVKGAINHIRHAFLGVIFILAVLYIFPTLLGLLGLQYGEYMRPSVVFETIGSISDRLFGQPIDAPSFGDINTDTTLPPDFSDL